MRTVFGAVFALAMGVAAFGVEVQAAATQIPDGDGTQLVRCGGPRSAEAPLWLACAGGGGSGGGSSGGGDSGGGDSGGTGGSSGGGGGGDRGGPRSR